MKKLANGAIAITAAVLILSAFLTVLFSVMDAIDISAVRILYALLALPQCLAAKLLLGWGERRMQAQQKETVK